MSREDILTEIAVLQELKSKLKDDKKTKEELKDQLQYLLEILPEAESEEKEHLNGW